jgi:hypothetical protein
MSKISKPRYAAILAAAALMAAGAGPVQRIHAAVPVIAEPARPLPLSAVRLTGGPLKPHRIWMPSTWRAIQMARGNFE